MGDFGKYHVYVVTDSPKMLRETLIVAQAAIGVSPLGLDRKKGHMNRLQRMIDECERKRPLGRHENHDDLHTPECGCSR